MKIVQVSTSDRILQSAHRLRREFLRLGHEAVMMIAERRGEDDPSVRLFHPPNDPLSQVGRYLRARQIERAFARYPRSRQARLSGFSDDRSPHGIGALAQLPTADVINVHSIHRFIDFGGFFRSVPRRTPVVRTLHDMSFLTGGCHLDEGCGRYTQECGRCPLLGSTDPRDISHRSWMRKSAALREVEPDRLVIVTPSRWLAEAARRSPLLQRFHVTVIPHGVDAEIFRPIERRVAREVLGIDPDARVVLFVAEGIQRPVKRFPLLVQALNGMGDISDLLLLSVGSGHLPVRPAIPHKHLGPIRDERFLSLVYNAADVFTVPSQQESFSLVTLESLACGVPVVGAAVGGIRELVTHGVTGLLVPPDDAAALRDAIRALVEDPHGREKMAQECRRVALEDYSIRVMATRYLALYERILTPGGVPARADGPGVRAVPEATGIPSSPPSP